MHFKIKKAIFLIIVLITFSNLKAQTTTKDSLQQKNKQPFNYKSLIVPSVLIGYGVIGLESESLKDLNLSTKNEFGEHIDEKVSLDDFSQYSSFLSVYGLNAFGIKGKHNFKDRTIILATAYLIMGTSVNIIKNAANEQRPDGTSTNSFPSGHTATAFMGAEFLFQEYKDVSIWYGIAGYTVATGTGFFRMYNQRHWLTDIAAGAGIGMLSTKIAYWLHPVIKRTFFKRSENMNGMVLPFYNGDELGVGFALSF